MSKCHIVGNHMSWLISSTSEFTSLRVSSYPANRLRSNTLVTVYVDLVVFTRISGTS